MVYTKELTKYGKLITIQEFKKYVKSRYFIDYDGFGRAVKDNLMTSDYYYPSQLKHIPKDATHIMWYNR